MMKLYHYTDVDGITAIQNSREILASQITGQDAVFGKGVYLTTFDPSHDKGCLQNLKIA